VEDAQSAIPVIVAVLKEQKLSYTKLGEINPSLEDVFVSIIEARDNSAGL
jgi:ABC-2 type transport system ATP-binding protein